MIEISIKGSVDTPFFKGTNKEKNYDCIQEALQSNGMCFSGEIEIIKEIDILEEE